MVIDLVGRIGAKKWSQIAQQLPGRIGKQCRERWHNHLNPAINKAAWTMDEDRYDLFHFFSACVPSCDSFIMCSTSCDDTLVERQSRYTFLITTFSLLSPFTHPAERF
mgnify:CR=1 FL=1